MFSSISTPRPADLAEKWKKIAICRIKKMMDAQFYPDGAQIELTPTYQCAAVEHIVSALKTAKDNGVEIDIDLDRFEFDEVNKLWH